MKNLMTRKLVIGLLMAFVLALGVRGTAEAISGIPAANEVNEDTIRVISSTANVGAAVALNANETRESVRITVSSGVELITPVPLSAGTDLTLTEGDTDGDGSETREAGQFVYSGDGIGTSISISVRFTRAGEQTVKIEDRTGPYHANDTAPDSLSATYVYYVQTNADTSDATVSLDGVRLTPFERGSKSGYETGSFGEYPRLIHRGDRNNYRVTYEVAGGGQVYVQDSASTRDPITVARTTSLTTFSGFDVYLDENGGSADGALGSTNVVTARVADSDARVRGVYVHGTPTLAIDITDAADNDANLVEDATQDEYKFINGAAGTDAGTITVTVTDAAATDNLVDGVIVKFELVNKINRGGYLTTHDQAASSELEGMIVTDINRLIELSPATSSYLGQTLYVLTNTSGEATVNYRFGTLGKQTIRVSSVGINREVIAELATVAPSNELKITGTRRSEDPDVYDLTVEIKEPDGETPLSGEVVTFRTDNGELNAVPVNTANSGRIITVPTNTLGKAHAVYDLQGNTGRQEIHASIGSGTRFQEETFVINGSGRSSTQPPPQQTARLTITVDGTGTTRAVTVTATNAQGVEIPGLSVTLSGTALTTSQTVNTGTPTVITLPSTPDDYTLIATLPGFASDTETITVGGATEAGFGTLTLTLGTRNGNQQPVTITATRDGSVQDVSYTLRVGSLVYTGDTGDDGSASRIITLPTATSSHTLTVSAPNYVTVRATALAPGQERDTTPSGPAGEADSIEIDGQRLRSSTVDEELDAPLRVRVVDANGRGVSDVRVTFRVLSPGRGTFPGARGSGLATQDETDRNGYVSVDFTPLSTGNVTVRVTAAKVRDPVTFIIDVSESTETETETETETRTPGPDVSQVTVDIDDAVVHIGAANRPPMLWVDGGKIYALVGANVQEFGSGVEGAMNVAIGGGKVYWTEMTGESSGTINSANLNGTGVKELTSILAVPMGIAVDTANSKLYWTNSRGRIQRANLDGSRIQNVMLNLPSPMDIAVARGNLYWTQYDATAGAGNVGIVNPNAAQKIATYIPTGADAPGSLVIGNGKVYWTEMTGTSSGTINSANLNRSGVTELASILAVPGGIAVDSARSKLYWTNSRGRIQSADLNGKKIQNIVDGLGMPGDMVLSNSIAAPAATTTTPTTASNKYDINGDGTVDAQDSEALTFLVLAGETNAKYDVNGDGTVDIKDVTEVIKNRTPGAASAPTRLGTQLSAVEIDRLQEQIDLLIATGDRSPAAIKTLIYLQQLIVMARPEKTQLLANYPNPFNPETWIPYELATDTTVRITIYNTQGVVIRTLELGHQSAGYYTGRDRAAYWDGRNALGEQVASGIYFYQFETDAMSSMRKMVILK